MATSYHPRWLAMLFSEKLEDDGDEYSVGFEILGTVFRDPSLRVVERPNYLPDEDGTRFYLDSDRFDDVAELAEAKSLQSELVDLLNGYCQLVWPGLSRIESDLLVELTPGGEVRGKPHITTVPKPVFLHTKDSIVDLLYEGGEAPRGKCSPMPDGVADVLPRSAVWRAMAFFGKRAPSWPEMYAVYEIIQNDIGGHVENQGWSTKADRRLFKRTAQYFESAGPEARHGHLSGEPPEDPMTLQEGREWIRGVLARWLRSLADEADDE